MQLLSLWVDGYKNLIDTSVDFAGAGVPIAVIGNNGTGKSNLIEVLFKIFISLYFGEPPKFKFRLTYTAHGKHVKVYKETIESPCIILVDGVVWSQNTFKMRAQQPSLRPPFPAMVFGYYSGTCKRLASQFKRYGRTYSAKLRNQSEDLERSFIFSDIDQAKYMLLALLAHRHFVFLRDVSILSLDRLTITLQPPAQYIPDSDEPRFWGTQGAILEFLADLDNAAVDTVSARRPLANEEANIEITRKYILGQAQLENVGRALTRRRASMFSMLQALQMKNMLAAVEFNLRHTDDITTFNFDELSEGEKQLISVIGGLWLTNKEECLVLLDEPDTHLNPAWTWKYNSLIESALGSAQSSSSTVLIATHNPVLISGLTKEQVLIAHNMNGRLTYEQPHRDPRGQGVANVLTSEFFGLPSSLDEHTQGLIDERLALAYTEGRLTDTEAARLGEINNQLDELGLSISFRDPAYKAYEESKYGVGGAR